MTRRLLTAPPAGIAVVGASERQFFARWTLLNLQRTGYAGRVLPVNPRAQPVLGFETWATVDDLPADPDLAVIAVRPEACLDAARALARRGCRTISVITDGFSESGGEDGRQLERQLAEWARSAGVALLGPNCVGFADVHAGVQAIGMPMPDMPPGGTAVISQSGGLLASIVDALVLERLGIDLALSLGNGAAFTLADALEECAARSTTDIVVAYIESLGDEPERVMAAVDALVADGRPVLVVKPGRSDTAQRVVQSHTASIAGDDVAVAALLRRHGVVRLDDIGDLARAARLARALPRGRRTSLAVLGASGGSASIVGDLAMLHGVQLAEFSAATQARLGELVPASGHVGNPVDLSGRAADVPQDLVYRAIAEDEHVDALLVPFSAPFPDGDPARMSHRDYLELLSQVAHDTSTPLIVASMGPQRGTGWISGLQDRYPGTLVVEGMAATMRALGALTSVGPGAPGRHETRPTGAEHPRLGVLSEADGRALLEELGVPVVPGVVVTDPDRVVDTPGLDDLRPPFVVKAVMPGVAHKARVGGVEVGVPDVSSLAAVCRSIAERTARHGIEPHGFLVQELIHGIELLIGLTRSPIAGMMVTVGLGGALAETTDHHASAVPPLDDASWSQLIADARIGRVLGSERSVSLGRHVRALCDAVASGRPRRLDELEINPLFLTHDGRLLAGDVLAIESKDVS